MQNHVNTETIDYGETEKIYTPIKVSPYALGTDKPLFLLVPDAASRHSVVELNVRGIIEQAVLEAVETGCALGDCVEPYLTENLADVLGTPWNVRGQASWLYGASQVGVKKELFIQAVLAEMMGYELESGVRSRNGYQSIITPSAVDRILRGFGFPKHYGQHFFYPTVVMGGQFPLLLTLVTTNEQNDDGRSGRVYFVMDKATSRELVGLQETPFDPHLASMLFGVEFTAWIIGTFYTEYLTLAYDEPPYPVVYVYDGYNNRYVVKTAEDALNVFNLLSASS